MHKIMMDFDSIKKDLWLHLPENAGLSTHKKKLSDRKHDKTSLYQRTEK